MRRISIFLIISLCWLLPTGRAMATPEGRRTGAPEYQRTGEPENRNTGTLFLAMGYCNQYDSYVSPLEYSGPQFSLLCNRERFLVRNRHISLQHLLDVQLHTSTNRNTAYRMYGTDAHYDLGAYYHWRNVIVPHLSMKAGGQLGGSIGGIFRNMSSNNPANAHATIRLSASVGTQYVLPLRRTQLSFNYQADLPMIGMAFSPDYGQSYYELWKYGYYHNLCFTSPANAFSIRQMFAMGIQLRNGTLAVGYKADIRQAELNNLRQHQYSHSFMIGWQTTFPSTARR